MLSLAFLAKILLIFSSFTGVVTPVKDENIKRILAKKARDSIVQVMDVKGGGTTGAGGLQI